MISRCKSCLPFFQYGIQQDFHQFSASPCRHPLDSADISGKARHGIGGATSSKIFCRDSPTLRDYQQAVQNILLKSVKGTCDVALIFTNVIGDPIGTEITCRAEYHCANGTGKDCTRPSFNTHCRTLHIKSHTLKLDR